MQMHEHVLTFRIENDDRDEVFIDIAKCMSIVSRKLFRQQGLWHVHGACTYADSVDGAGNVVGVPYTVAVSGASRTYVVRNALVKAFEVWKDQQQKAYEALGTDSVKPKWQDFKVWLSEEHRDNGDIVPVAGAPFVGSDPFIAGEWSKSRIVYSIADDVTGEVSTVEPYLHIIGDDDGVDTVGLVKQYAESRSLVTAPEPQTPTNIEDNIYALESEALGNQVEEIITNLTFSNDMPPYDHTMYPQGASNGNMPICYAFAANGSTAKRKLTLNGFSAPNGLIAVQWDKDALAAGAVANTGNFWLQIFVSHREAY